MALQKMYTLAQGTGDHAITVTQGYSHGFLADNMLASLRGFDRMLAVKMARCRDVHHVDSR